VFAPGMQRAWFFFAVSEKKPGRQPSPAQPARAPKKYNIYKLSRNLLIDKYSLF